MHKLATGVWDGRNNAPSCAGNKIRCRLDWVHQKNLDYFRNSKVQNDKLKLLDVGSCYNPFRKFGDCYDITAIDLCPARGCEDVLKCDFLQLKVGDRRVENEESNSLIELKESSFDIVVFSFFLEYLPDRKQRIESCRKARDLLKTGGILYILRPDSNHDGPGSINTKLVKALKVGNAVLGLKRIFLEKLEHLWCMGFVKISPDETSAYLESPRFLKDVAVVEKTLGKDVTLQKFETLFGIHQDLRREAGLESSEVISSKSVEVQPELFNELPLLSMDV